MTSVYSTSEHLLKSVFDKLHINLLEKLSQTFERTKKDVNIGIKLVIIMDEEDLRIHYDVIYSAIPIDNFGDEISKRYTIATFKMPQKYMFQMARRDR
jgi:hypothetical protein